MSERAAAITAGLGTVGASPRRAPAPRERRLELRLIPDLERSAALVRLAATPLGRVGVVAVFGVLAWIRHEPMIAAGAALAVLFPARRRVWVGLMTFAMLLLGERQLGVVTRLAQAEGWGSAERWLQPGALILAVLLTVAYVQFAKTTGSRVLMRRPVATFVTAYVALVAAVSWAAPAGHSRVLAWALVAALGSYLWFGAYSLKDRVERRGKLLALDASAFWPFWGSSHTPLPKAGAHLAKIEVRNAEEAAVWQLKGIKLMAWAQLLACLRAVVAAVASGQGPLASRLPCLHVPTFADALAHSAAGNPLGWSANWAALAHSFVINFLDFAIWGHVVVAGARMAGFKALRNMHRPLAATSLADFWNRFYFYFKELLVDFFFFPTYLRYFKSRPRLRLLFATFAAAGFGNFLYHYLTDVQSIAERGFLGALWGKQAYALYCFVLALGIGLSQLRGQRSPPAPPTGLALARTRLGVVAFFFLLTVPNEARAGTTLKECAEFFLRLVP